MYVSDNRDKTIAEHNYYTEQYITIWEVHMNYVFCCWNRIYFNPFNPEFTIVIFIHYKPRIAAAILDL